jgi:hypothetical protein
MSSHAQWVMLRAVGLAAVVSLQPASGAIILGFPGGKLPEEPGKTAPTNLNKTLPEPAGADPAYSDTVRFLNGDVLHGNLVAIDGDKTLRWRRPDAKEEIEFAQTRLSKILMPRPRKGAAVPATAWLVRLSNGDEVPGELVSLDAEKLILNTAGAGALSLPRRYVQSLRQMAGGSRIVFEGPTGMEGWSSSNPAGWKYLNGGFTTTGPGGIGRDVKLPPLARLEFDLAWRGQLVLLLSFYTDGLEEEWGANNAYMLQLNQGWVYLQRMRRQMGGSNLGNCQVQSLFNKTRVHVELLCNKPAKTIALALDGVLVKQWTDNNEWVGGGTGVLFAQQGNGLTRVSDLRVSEWDGKFEEASAPAVRAKEDLLELANHDKITGNLQGIRDGKISLATAFAPMDIPVERAQVIELSSIKTEVVKTKPNDVRGSFVGRGWLTFSLEKYDGKQLVASSPTFGQARFAAAAFDQFVFNLEAQKKLAAREGLDGGGAEP